MGPHGIHPEEGRKEISCSDCGHSYIIARGQQSAVCQACGNIEFFGENVAALSQAIVAKRVLPRLQEKPAAPDPLAPFRAAVDGKRVEDFRVRYQVEWQLWATLTQRFEDPALHSAYLCQAIATDALDRAAERYCEHRSVMALLADSQWQAEVSDLMLARIEGIAISRLPVQPTSFRLVMPSWLLLAPFQGNLVRAGWIALGLFAGAKLFRLHL